MQCKDISDKTILEWLADRQGVWCNWFPVKFDNYDETPNERSVLHAMPEGLAFVDRKRTVPYNGY